MIKNFKSKFFKTTLWFVLFFVVLFVSRLIYGYYNPGLSNTDNYSPDFFQSISDLRKNYASEKMKGDYMEAPLSEGSSQKYEKTAYLRIKSSQFSQDEAEIRSKAKQFNAVIQYEQNQGRVGNREIHLLVGVHPELFDSLYQVYNRIGSLKGTEITKVDKTNEYRQLNAKKASIEKTLQSLNELKAKGGEIPDFVSLNEKILEMEEKAQELGVELGNFNTANEFCTIKISMAESKAAAIITFSHRIKVAFLWAAEYFVRSVLVAFLVSISVLVLILLLDRLRIISSFSKNSEN